MFFTPLSDKNHEFVAKKRIVFYFLCKITSKNTRFLIKK